ncbi:MAG: hypothetical protein AB2A00_43085 [Myxococcota bacterium]
MHIAYSPIFSTTPYEYSVVGDAWNVINTPGFPPTETAYNIAFDPVRARTVIFGGFNGLYDINNVYDWDGASFTDISPRTGTRPNVRTGPGMVWDSGNRRMLQYGGGHFLQAQGSEFWEFDARTGSVPAVQFSVSAQAAGIAGGTVSGLRVRAWCGGESPSGTGCALYGWSASAGNWTALPGSPSNAIALNPSQPYLPTGTATLLDWTASEAEAEDRYLLGAGELAFQCRALGGNSASPSEAAVAMDHMEVRVRYLADAAYNWDFNVDNVRDGWRIGADATETMPPTGGLWTLAPGALDPRLEGPLVEVDATRYRRVELRIANTDSTGTARLYWQRSNDPSYSESKSQGFTLPNDGLLNTVTVDLTSHPEWNGTITLLRLDPVEAGTGGTIAIDHIRVIE